MGLLRNSFVFFSILSQILLFSSIESVAQIKLAWDPNTDPDLAGYRVYYGTASRSYGLPIDVGNVTTCTVPGLTPGVTYYFAITAYDISHNESGYSNEVFGMVTPSALENVSVPNTPKGPTSGVVGVTCDYSSFGSQSNLGHSIQYRFDWGDGTHSDWSASTDASKTWLFPGTYSVRAKARCSVHTTIESDWSEGLPVTVSQNNLVDLTGELTSLVQTCRDTRRGKKCTISGKLTIENIGTLNAPSSSVRFYLSDDTQYDEGSDTFLKQIVAGRIKAGKSKTKILHYSFPVGETASGKYLIAVMDADNTVMEGNENNNYVLSEKIPYSDASGRWDEAEHLGEGSSRPFVGDWNQNTDVSIPTMTVWGLMILAVLLGTESAYCLRRLRSTIMDKNR